MSIRRNPDRVRSLGLVCTTGVTVVFASSTVLAARPASTASTATTVPTATAASTTTHETTPVAPAVSSPTSSAPSATVTVAATTAIPPAPSGSESAPAARRITLTEALNVAKEHAPAVVAALARIEQSRAQVDLSRAALLPTVSNSTVFSTSLSIGSAFFGGVIVPSQSLSMMLDTAINVRWTFYDFGRTPRNVALAERNVDVMRENSRVTERQALSGAAGAYMVVLADQQLAAAAREIVAQRERQAEITHGLVAAGARAPVEGTRADLALETARIDLENAAGTAQVDTALLAASIGLDPLVPLELVDVPAVEIETRPDLAVQRAGERAEVTAARMQLEAARAQLDVAHAARLPTLSMSGSVNFRVTESLLPLRPDPLASTQPGVSVSLNVPIFDPTINANIRVAEANIAVQSANLEQVEFQSRGDVVQSALAVQAAGRSLAQNERAAQLAAINLAQVEGLAQAGSVPMLQLIDAQAADATAKVNVVRARLQLELARVRLAGSTGDFGPLGFTATHGTPR